MAQLRIPAVMSTLGSLGRNSPWLCAMLMLLQSTSSVGATVLVQVEPSILVLSVGDPLEVALRADLGDPVLGFGLDLETTLLMLSGPPVVGPAWIQLLAPDGDGIAGAAPSGTLSGNGVLLATLFFIATAPGTADLIPAITPADPTEGFPLDPSGFAGTLLIPAQVLILPEPAPLLLHGSALLGLLLSGRRPTRARVHLRQE